MSCHVGEIGDKFLVPYLQNKQTNIQNSLEQILQNWFYRRHANPELEKKKKRTNKHDVNMETMKSINLGDNYSTPVHTNTWIADTSDLWRGSSGSPWGPITVYSYRRSGKKHLECVCKRVSKWRTLIMSRVWIGVLRWAQDSLYDYMIQNKMTVSRSDCSLEQGWELGVKSAMHKSLEDPCWPRDSTFKENHDEPRGWLILIWLINELGFNLQPVCLLPSS